MMDEISFITKWYITIPSLLVIYILFQHVYTFYLRFRYNAYQVTNQNGDGYYGFKFPFDSLKAKLNGSLLEFTMDGFITCPKPEIATFRLQVFFKDLIMTRDPENIKAILATQFNDFSLGTRHAHFQPLLGDGIFTLDGAGWKHSRQMLRPQFARDQISHVKMLEPHIQLLFKQIRANSGSFFDIQELFFRFTVDSATEFLFGESVQSLRDDKIGMGSNSIDFDGKSEFTEAFNFTQNYVASRSMMQQFYWLFNSKQFKQANSKVHKFADHYVQKALSLTPEEMEKQNGYVFLYELAKQTRDPSVLRDQLLNILVAGRDTTAGLLSFTFFELARNAEIFNKLKTEIDEKFGLGSNARLEDITFESLKSCEYLKAVLNEALRLYPSVPINFRIPTRNSTLPKGGGKDGQDPILVKKGQTILYSVYCLHRDPVYYGKDVDDFIPERWFKPEMKKIGWAFVPFNGGPRICLGQQFALTEASYVVVRLIQEFGKLQLNPNAIYPPKKMSHLTMSLFDGCIVKME
ncbi:unnamed protein product [Candida verbasci]|uniref:Uncharacterized protein n=1 Tax=Candida verbasci TaxID=1227364 RepID=A0A9W4XIH8_9ASCO|nr:unnamed protein product [Candida verbasci]